MTTHRDDGSDGGDSFVVDDISVGAYAHGFGRTGDGHTFAFKVRGKALYLDIYRSDCDTDVPDARDVEAAAESDVTEIDLDDERSVVAAVRDAVSSAVSVDLPGDALTIRALLGRLGSVIDP